MIGCSTIETGDDYILIRLGGGAYRPIDIMSTITRAWRAIKSHQCKKILAVREKPAKTIVSFFYLYKLAEYLSKQNVAAVRVALVLPQVMHTEEIQAFGAAMRGKGLALQLFSDYQDGEDWLLRQTPQRAPLSA